MIITLRFARGQPAIFHWPFIVSSLLSPAARVLLLLALPLCAETHSNVQSVTAVGTSARNGAYPFTVTGVLLTDADEMLDATPNFQLTSSNTMGGEWQVTV